MRILQALIRAHEANAEAMRLLMEDDDRPTEPPSSLPPPGMREPGSFHPTQQVQRTVDTLSTNHRDPGFAKRPTRFSPQVTAAAALGEVRKLWSSAKDPGMIDDARAVGAKLVAVNLISQVDLDEVFETEPGRG